ncbi:MAG: DUF2339 domain-containing protein [Muribaculaceae bacterium]|nr:DUF2339 domain-containing protein [Muribaculaceae bacterium]
MRKTGAEAEPEAQEETPPAVVPVDTQRANVVEQPQPAPEEAEVWHGSKPTEPIIMEKAPKTPLSRRIEKLVGENLMSKLGALALVVGIGFFLKFAIDNNWINEAARTALGLLVGFGLWGIAYSLRDTYRSFSSVLAGAGFAICFVTIAVAYNYYELFSAPVALSILVALMVILTWIALRYDRRELAVTAVLGGYIAPFLSAGPDGSLITLLGYTALLSAAACFISYRRGWWAVTAAGMIATWIIVAVTAYVLPNEGAEAVAVACFCTLFYTLFSLPVATVLRHVETNKLIFVILLGEIALNQIAYLIFGINAADSSAILTKVQGFVPLYVGLLNGFLFLKYYRADSDIVASSLRWIAIIGFTLFAPVQFTEYRVVGGLWAVYSLLLVLAFVRYGHGEYLLASLLVAVLDWAALSMAISKSDSEAAIALLISGACYMAISYQGLRHEDVFWPKLGRRVAVFLGVILNVGCGLLTYGIEGLAIELVPSVSSSVVSFTSGMAIMVVIACIWQPNRYTAGFMSLWGILWLAWDILVGTAMNVAETIIAWTGVLLLGCAISIFAKKKLTALPSRKQNPALVYFSLIGAAYVIEVLDMAVYTSGLTSYYSAAFSVGLIIAGAAVMALGLRYRRLVLRTTSLGLFGLLLVKLLAYDLWRLPIVGRIVVFILLGVVLLSLSFFYQKLKDTFFAHDSHTREE